MGAEPEPSLPNLVLQTNSRSPDLTAAPYGLDDEAIAWVRSTIDSTTTSSTSIVDTYHPGGMRYNHTDSASIQAHIRHAQSRSKVPLLVASNIEAGGNGACNDGTHVATRCRPRPPPTPTPPDEMGLVGGRESRALGCNWAFTPIVDIHPTGATP